MSKAASPLADPFGGNPFLAKDAKADSNYLAPAKINDNSAVTTNKAVTTNPAVLGTPSASKPPKGSVGPVAGVPGGLPKGLTSLLGAQTHRQVFSGQDAANISGMKGQLQKLGFGVQITRTGHAIVHASRNGTGGAQASPKAAKGGGAAHGGGGGHASSGHVGGGVTFGK